MMSTDICFLMRNEIIIYLKCLGKSLDSVNDLVGIGGFVDLPFSLFGTTDTEECPGLR